VARLGVIADRTTEGVSYAMADLAREPAVAK
jgi:hypothetical protein